jgi:hypothetical protein
MWPGFTRGTARWIDSSSASSRIPDPPEPLSGKDAAGPARVRGLDRNYLKINQICGIFWEESTLLRVGLGIVWALGIVGVLQKMF